MWTSIIVRKSDFKYVSPCEGLMNSLNAKHLQYVQSLGLMLLLKAYILHTVKSYGFTFFMKNKDLIFCKIIESNFP